MNLKFVIASIFVAIIFLISFDLVQAQSSPPNPPSQLTVTPSSATTLNLTWTPPNDIVKGYKIMYQIDNGTFQDLVSNTGTNSAYFVSRNLIADHTYSYQVFAINSVGQSIGSNIASATLSSVTNLTNSTSTPSPVSLTAIPTLGGTLLSWIPPQNNGSNITGYKIEFSPSPNRWLVLNNNTGTQQTYFQTNISSLPNYAYRVSAINSIGNPSLPISASSNIQSGATPILTGNVISSNQVMLSWIPPSYTYGQQIIGYKIELKSGSSYVSQVDNTGLATSQIVSGLIPDKTYTYRVTALYAGDTQSPPSPDFTITPL